MYGGKGYLGSRLFSTLEDSTLFQRDEMPNYVKKVFDFSFPRDFHNVYIFREYTKTIIKRLVTCERRKIKYMYAGSTSSYPPQKSMYSRQKMQIENLVKSKGGVIIRQGLVINKLRPGGRYKEFITTINKLPIIILPNSQTFRVMVTEEEDFIDSWNKAQHIELTNCSDYLVKNTFETSLESLTKDVDVSSKIVLKLGSKSSHILQAFIRNTPIKAIDSLRSISQHKEYKYENKI